MFAPRLPGKENKISISLYKIYELKLINLLKSIDILNNRPEWLDIPHIELLQNYNFRISGDEIEKILKTNDFDDHIIKLIQNELTAAKEFGKYLKEYRHKLKLNQADVINKITDMTANEYSKIERGKLIPNLVDIPKLFVAFWPYMDKNVHDLIMSAGYTRK